MSEIQFQNDIHLLTEVLPSKIRRHIQEGSLDDAIEIVLDIGRIPEVRIGNGKIVYLGNDTDTCQRNIHTIGRICAIIPQCIIHGNLYDCHRNLVYTGSHPQGNNRLQIFRPGLKSLKRKLHIPEFRKIDNDHNP